MYIDANIIFNLLFAHLPLQCNLFFQESLQYLDKIYEIVKEEKPKLRSILKKPSHSIQTIKMVDGNQMDTLSQSPRSYNDHARLACGSVDHQSAYCAAVDRAAAIAGLVAINLQEETSGRPDLTRFARMSHFIKAKVLP